MLSGLCVEMWNALERIEKNEVISMRGDTYLLSMRVDDLQGRGDVCLAYLEDNK